MKRLAAALCCVFAAGALSAQSANVPIDETIDSPLEYYFGALALVALLMTWAWVWLKLKQRQAVQAEMDEFKLAAGSEKAGNETAPEPEKDT